MTDSKEGAKDSLRPGDTPAQKRPHATLDLKATEVKGTQKPGAEPKDAAAPPEAAKGSTAVGAGEAQRKSAGAGSSQAAKPGATKAGAGPEPAGAPPPAARGRVLTHLLAGLVGGVVALAGANEFGERLGITRPGVEESEATLLLQKRIAALEQTLAASSATEELEQKLASTEARLGKLDELSASLAGISEQQSKLETETKSLAEKLAEQPSTSATEDRIAKLEDRLSTLAAAAETDADPGRIQGLAALTGKVADLTDGLATRFEVERKSIIDEMEQRLAPAIEASEAARTGTQRIDRDVSELRTEAARLGQRIDTVSGESDRLKAALATLQSDAASTAGAVASLEVAVEDRLSSVARSADVQSAMSPVTEKLAEIERRLQGVVESEDQRKANASRIVIALELANLKRAIEQGAGYGPELSEVKKAAAGRLDLTALEAHKDSGVPAIAELEQELKPVIRTILEASSAPAEGSVLDKLLSSARSVVKVRKLTHDPDDTSVEAVLGRMETALGQRRLGDVLAFSKELPPDAEDAAQDWLGKVEVRHSVDRAIASIEDQLKTSLSGAAPEALPTLQN